MSPLFGPAPHEDVDDGEGHDAPGSGPHALPLTEKTPVPSSMRLDDSCYPPAPTSPRPKHASPVHGGQGYWWVDRLWLLSADLRPFRAPLDCIQALDLDCWFDGQESPTLRAVARHAKRIAEVDVSYPVILSARGVLMDGAHRVARAWADGQDWVLAVQFTDDPEPDWTEASA